MTGDPQARGAGESAAATPGAAPAPPDLRRLRRGCLAGVLGLLVLVGALASWLLAAQLLTPQRRAPDALPEGVGFTWQDLTLHTRDGLLIAAWAVTPDRAPGAVALLLHAKDGCRSAHRVQLAADAGLAVLALDLRAHGESEGRLTGLGWHERAEVAAAVEEARRRWPGLPLVGWGVSMGAAALVYSVDPASPDALPPDSFAALVLESLYTDIDSAFANRVRLRLGAWALPAAALVKWLASWRGGLEPAGMQPLASLGRLHAATGDALELLLASGADDRRTPPADLWRLAEAGGGRALLVPGADHEDLLAAASTDEWERTVVAFLTRYGAARR